MLNNYFLFVLINYIYYAFNMRKPRTDKEKAAFIELRDKREKISKEMKNLSPEELKVFIAERLTADKLKSKQK